MRALLKYLGPITFGTIIFISSVHATPANAIHAKYDLQRQELLVKVEHQSSKCIEHFIERVDVSRNGSAVATETFTFQTSHRNQTMPPIKFSAKPGDTITITAICNRGGIKKSEIIVKK